MGLAAVGLLRHHAPRHSSPRLPPPLPPASTQIHSGCSGWRTLRDLSGQDESRPGKTKRPHPQPFIFFPGPSSSPARSATPPPSPPHSPAAPRAARLSPAWASHSAPARAPASTATTPTHP